MATGWTPPAKGTHVFVVLRHDSHVKDVSESIVGTRAFLSLKSAQEDATRLNALNADKEATYFVVVARLQIGNEARS
jgi:hypothetical protein